MIYVLKYIHIKVASHLSLIYTIKTILFKSHYNLKIDRIVK